MMQLSMTSLLSTPFVQIALPIIITMVLANWNANRNFTQVNLRITDLVTNMNARFTAIENRLTAMENRLTGIETRLGAVERKVEGLEARAWR